MLFKIHRQENIIFKSLSINFSIPVCILFIIIKTELGFTCIMRYFSALYVFCIFSSAVSVAASCTTQAVGKAQKYFNALNYLIEHLWPPRKRIPGSSRGAQPIMNYESMESGRKIDKTTEILLPSISQPTPRHGLVSLSGGLGVP